MLRPIQAKDILSITAIEAAANALPWSQQMLFECLQPDYDNWLVEVDKQIIGFIILNHGPDEAHLLDICVEVNYQYQGYGRQLLQKAIEQAKAHNKKRILLEVRVSNDKAIRLYEKVNFEKIGVRKKYYKTAAGREDALVMGLTLTH